ncbi:MAG: hypothetical protein KAX37_08040 [Opitutaceae bacterium]|nr:hypothetical protein [Opitutaceae bacterium]
MRVIPAIALILLAPLSAFSAVTSVSIIWKSAGASGRIQVDRGKLIHSEPTLKSTGEFALDSARGGGRLDLSVESQQPEGSLPAVVSVSSMPRGFAFRLDEVGSDFPIFLPEDRIIVTSANDTRTYDEIVAAIQSGSRQTTLQEIATAPEASFATSATASRNLKAATWLGLSRDMRLFRIDERMETLQPKDAGYNVRLPELPSQPAIYAFECGRGWGPQDAIRRHLDEGDLPILRGEIDDGPVRYELTFFTSPERSPLSATTLRGTDFLVADAHGHGHMFTPAQAEEEKRRASTELNPPEEVILHARITAENRGDAPRHAFFRTVVPTLAMPVSPKLPAWTYDTATGVGAYASSGRIFSISRLNGAPLPAEEVSLLLQPGKKAVFEFAVPHRPLGRERAEALVAESFETRLNACRAFWRAKLATAAQVRLPEARTQAMLRAGLLHLDLVSYGREPDGALLPAIGIYTAIGSESAPIIQFMDSMGWHTTAARAIDFFLEKQHDNGFMQNFNGYMLETGAVLWTMGEHYRYTRDDTWLRRVHPNLTRAWHFLRDWRQRNLQPGLEGNGHGMLDGKTADPEDPYRSYMLNGYAYLGLARTAEMLGTLAPAEAAECRIEADALKRDIRASFIAGLERSPVVPLGDGTWMRASAPWTNYRGPVMLHTDGGSWFTHGTNTARDSLLGPLYLVFQEVIAPHEPLATELLATQSELMLRDEVAFSQPYYSRHPWVHLQRGETKAFLKSWYGAMASLADRETYTFNEHFFPVSEHKTHEEAWFLMQTRWMLYMEQGETLRLLAGIPRAYLVPGAVIEVKDAASYFGPLSFRVETATKPGRLRAAISCPGARHPSRIELRLPLPGNARVVTTEGGDYQADSETVIIQPFTGHAEISLAY